MNSLGVASDFMQGSEVRVNFVVMRATEPQEEGGRGVRRPEPQYFRRRSEYMKVGPLCQCSSPTAQLACFCLPVLAVMVAHRTHLRHTQWKEPPPLQVLVRADTCVIAWR